MSQTIQQLLHRKLGVTFYIKINWEIFIHWVYLYAINLENNWLRMLTQRLL